MMNKDKKYDGDMQQVVEPLVIKPGGLGFMRWMVEQGRIGRQMGPSSGEFAISADLPPTNTQEAARRVIVGQD